jgi:hypothetical protein
MALGTNYRTASSGKARTCSKSRIASPPFLTLLGRYAFPLWKLLIVGNLGHVGVPSTSCRHTLSMLQCVSWQEFGISISIRVDGGGTCAERSVCRVFSRKA